MDKQDHHSADRHADDQSFAAAHEPENKNTTTGSSGNMLPGKSRFMGYSLLLFALLIGGIGVYLLINSRAAEQTIYTEKTPKLQLLTEKLKADARAYQSDMPANQKPKTNEMQKIAQERKAELLALVQNDPDAFLAQAISKEDRAKLPKEVSSLVEEATEAEGVFNGETVVVKGRTYKLGYNKTLPLFIDPNSTTTFKGYILDDHFVIPATPDGYKENARNTSGQKPFANVALEYDAAGGVVTGSTGANGTGTVIPGVPGYAWRDGCAPTVGGMVLGYWDGHGYGNLISGDAFGVTGPVNQMIASHSVSGERRHYEDYSLPKETGSTVIADRSAAPAGDEHAADSLADYMHTSWSADGNLYGWTYSSKIAPAIATHFTKKYPTHTMNSATYAGTAMTFALLKQEVTAKRPMILLVDSNGDGRSDHFVTAVGYRTSNGYNEYASWDTWSTTGLRWQRFRPMSTSYNWGIWGGFTFAPAVKPTTPAPVINSFTVTPSSITAGQSATLSWSVSNTATISINQNIGAVAVSGSKVVAPPATTTYTITAANSGGTVTKSVTVTVAPAPATPPPDTTPPAVSISGLTNNGSYSNGNYTVTGTASDASGISRMEIFLGNTLVATCSASTQCSYNINMKKLSPGTYTVKVVAYDKAATPNSASNFITFTRQ